MPSFTLREIAQHLGAELYGNSDHEINGIASLQMAGNQDLSFLANPTYKKYLSTTNAGAVLINFALVEEFTGNKIVVEKPYEAYAKLTSLFKPGIVSVKGVHPTAVIGNSVVMGRNISIGPNAVIGNGVIIADDVVIGAGCCIGDLTEIGRETELRSNVTVYHHIKIGSQCLFHSGSVIGADGFGFAPTKNGWIKIHQLGRVIIGNSVEIGANTCIDRGALEDTVIEDGVIIDNLVQIGHNVKIGRNTAIAAHTAIAGSTVIGNQCTIAGAVGIVGHIQITDNVHITGMSMVSSSIAEPGSYSSGTALSETKEWRKNAVRFRQLNELANRIQKLEHDKK